MDIFDELIRETQRLEDPVAVAIDMPLDEKGYFDRKCHHGECKCEFKVLLDDWRDKVPDEMAFCPKCGQRGEPSDFDTPWQRDYIETFAQSVIAHWSARYGR